MNYLEKYKEHPLTYTLMFISLVVFLLGSLSTSLDQYFYTNGVLHGYSVIMKGEFLRLVNSTFLHSDMIHLLMNMLSLLIVGRVVEGLFTKAAYLSIYFLAAFFGSFTAIYMDLGVHAVGASGAIFGLFGALAGFAFVHRNTMRSQFIAFMKNFGLILVLNLVIGFAFPSISISAHVGGLIAGMVGGFIIAKNPKYIVIYIVFSLILLIASEKYLTMLYYATI
ncbi:MAG: FIG056164: rhomboid family serine protease [uncultured Sulfurovum sp.]|uniref:FIG056164: rhomboid family serine protease n=1 Tax=uncultured Sulfurovum sp. TaxID=269237 RepID=A0A6S6SH59_9BACT|nr:MAG: FIG056164: rhomboid family serine protease [uncultured Sulfurovum sp.]